MAKPSTTIVKRSSAKKRPKKLPTVLDRYNKPTEDREGFLVDMFGRRPKELYGPDSARERATSTLVARGHTVGLQHDMAECARCGLDARIVGGSGAYKLAGPMSETVCAG